MERIGNIIDEFILNTADDNYLVDNDLRLELYFKISKRIIELTFDTISGNLE